MGVFWQLLMLQRWPMMAMKVQWLLQCKPWQLKAKALLPQ